MVYNCYIGDEEACKCYVGDEKVKLKADKSCLIRVLLCTDRADGVKKTNHEQWCVNLALSCYFGDEKVKLKGD